MESINLEQIDQLEILTLQDNYIDLASQDGNEMVQRAMPLKGMAFANSITAEHGFSTMVSADRKGCRNTMLFDFGFSPTGASENAKKLGVDFSSVEMLALSHGHIDHSGGFETMVKNIDKKGLPMVAHPSAFKENRVIKITEEFKITMPMLSKETIKKINVDLIEAQGPYPIFGGKICFLGEIPKTNNFEKGSVFFYYQENEQEKWDPMDDDTALIAHLRGKGLIVLSGCAHSGIANTVKYAQEITGIDKVHAIMGGFHLTGPEFSPIIETTVNALKDINPDFIIPTHCTGRNAMMRIQKEMPEQYLLNMAGTRMVFKA
ncbi:MAG: MBL fold metallo-hydrolase [Proteobacteria bacterium]|nr:MBL fold metallo-hydrolase [Pseudomonadota bacterium]MBU4133227.1 MBL fold metallo-hydrolase [Pseudomonadota bacterium]